MCARSMLSLKANQRDHMKPLLNFAFTQNRVLLSPKPPSYSADEDSDSRSPSVRDKLQIILLYTV